MDQNAIDEVLNRPLSQELLARDLARLAFIGLDGTPRSIPIGIVWNGTEIAMCTATNARKLPALRRNPAVALTIDTESHPPKVLLIRGQAELDVVDGIPDEYFQWNGTYEMTPEQRAEWEEGVKSLYDGMVRVMVKPTWAKLIDFETTLPTAIEELMQQQKERHGNCRDCSPKFRRAQGGAVPGRPVSGASAAKPSSVPASACGRRRRPRGARPSAEQR